MREIIIFAIKICMVAALLVGLYIPLKSHILEDRIYEAALLECIDATGLSNVADKYRDMRNMWLEECRTWANHTAEGGRGIGQP